ncbi:hypothetical protein F5B21DRAFT_486532 [Xylaria acuta]|nr:hypothetical protein F5B21DRAFT_486532 [Xylaria acuta]
MASTDPLHTISEATTDTISPLAFYILNWVFFGLCNVAFGIRAYIRYVCFRRLLFEDYLMLVALIMHGVIAVLIQLYVRHAYDLQAFQQGDMSHFGPNSFYEFNKAFVATGTCFVLAIVGLALVKLNFLLFFRRLGASIKGFRIMWWAVLLFTFAITVAQLGMQDYGCFYGGAAYIFSDHCGSAASIRRIFFNAVFSAVVDAVSDTLIVALPVTILWRSRIQIRQKLILTFVFGLVFLTIAITIVRGSIFHKGLDSSGSVSKETQNITFTWFWFYAEFTVAFIVACIASFRSLFVHRDQKSAARREEEQRRKANYQSAMRRGWRARLNYWHDSVLDTCRTLEGWSGSSAETLAMHRLPTVPSGLLTVDFQDDANWSKGESRQERPVTAESILQTPNTAYLYGVAR